MASPLVGGSVVSRPSYIGTIIPGSPRPPSNGVVREDPGLYVPPGPQVCRRPPWRTPPGHLYVRPPAG